MVVFPSARTIARACSGSCADSAMLALKPPGRLIGNFVGEMSTLVARYLRRLFLIGTGTSAIPDEQAQEDFDEEREIHEDAIDGLATYIYNGRYDENEDTGQTAEVGLALLLARMTLWANKGAGAYSLGQLHNPAVDKYGWRLGNTAEHCSDCQRLDRQVHTKEAWRGSGFRPQGSNLECGGWHCDCKLLPSTADESGGF